MPAPNSRTGVLLVNLGSPAEPSEPAVRAYLAQFLGDRRVVDWPRWLWLPILHGVILRRRPARVAQAYARVWTHQGSPLVATTRALGAQVEQLLGEHYAVRAAMRYGSPSMEEALASLPAHGARVLVPLFPQAAEATTGSIEAEWARLLAEQGDVTAHSRVRTFEANPNYLDSVANSVREALAHWPAEHLLVSFHGLPVRVGRAYAARCRTTFAGLMERLPDVSCRISLCFQSRFGPERWLGPATDETALALAGRAQRVLVVCPGFAADCLETLDEIGVELAQRFHRRGGGELRLVPGLDLRPDWIRVVADLVREAVA